MPLTNHDGVPRAARRRAACSGATNLWNREHGTKLRPLDAGEWSPRDNRLRIVAHASRL